jgi:hypothetical protein
VAARLEGESAGHAQIAAADFEDRVEGAVVEGDARGARDRAAVRDVPRELLAREQPELRVVDDAAGHGLLLVTCGQCLWPSSASCGCWFLIEHARKHPRAR